VSPLTGFAPVTPASTPGSFQTFCIGTQVNYTPGTTYYYQISDTVQPSGTGGVGPPGYVTFGTAYLYSEYRAGAFNTLIADGPNTQESDALQAAIWTLQGQSFGSGIVSFGSEDPNGPTQSEINYFLNLASNEATLDHVTHDTNNANGAFGVYALNLSTSSTFANGDWAQPQLVIVPEPTTVVAGGLMLLPFGAALLRLARKRLA
jgi:hypothetical protein